MKCGFILVGLHAIEVVFSFSWFTSKLGVFIFNLHLRQVCLSSVGLCLHTFSEYVLCVPAVSEVSLDIWSAIATHVYQEDGPDVNIMMWHDLHPSISHQEKEIVFVVKEFADYMKYVLL